MPRQLSIDVEDAPIITGTTRLGYETPLANHNDNYSVYVPGYLDPPEDGCKPGDLFPSLKHGKIFVHNHRQWIVWHCRPDKPTYHPVYLASYLLFPTKLGPQWVPVPRGREKRKFFYAYRRIANKPDIEMQCMNRIKHHN
ncbi:hypothetical protein FA15DRAFT_711888 [Coprinopsis marcescibilis]|uniref:Uncharacterized protein n=1 Tax=Coprinopsis marcescibilis TaxID=230819 RepID=A0A5C3K8L1_COPMA|nr:hypothetical protein FA15DRAFT_711888 [Coprinopsis marcescibilis]